MLQDKLTFKQNLLYESLKVGREMAMQLPIFFYGSSFAGSVKENTDKFLHCYRLQKYFPWIIKQKLTKLKDLAGVECFWHASKWFFNYLGDYPK